MYVYYNDRGFMKLNADIRKTVRLDDYSYTAIVNMEGKTFSEKLRNLINEYMSLKK